MIFLGPMYIHGSSTNVDYVSFFSDHLRSVLDAPSSPLVGSDDENALKKPVSQAWPYGKQLYCPRYLY